MSIEDQVVALAAQAHCAAWSAGKDVSAQTRKAQDTCKHWQQAVKERFQSRFEAECGISGEKCGPSQKIDLVDVEERVAYELKSSPNNVHMEIYRDVFKALVFNERNSSERILTLVFIAPKAGIQKLGTAFPKDVQAISARMGLILKLREVP
jgi:hypothetical protein